MKQSGKFSEGEISVSLTLDGERGTGKDAYATRI